MTYQALYREWRPATFNEVSGQEHIKRTLMNMLKQQRIPHALLFCGPRGTGKTSMAKILARAVNCGEGVRAEPCLNCTACRNIANNTSIDVLEIDAASNRGIDEIRELREHVKFAPSELRYKVYIIDEVHMLTTEAFNALLKTLEEPPSYVLFILATTEPHKLPATIISRCQRFDFRRLSQDSIIARLQEISRNKGADLSIEAAKLIAEQAQGGMRDALGMLEQCMSFSEDNVSLETVETVTGSVPTTVYQRVLNALVQGDVARALELLHAELTAGREAGQYLRSYITALRLLLLAAHSPQVLELQGYEISNLKKLADDVGSFLPELILLALSTENDMRYGGHPRLHLELLIVRQHQVMSGVRQGEAKTEDEVVRIENIITPVAEKRPLPERPQHTAPSASERTELPQTPTPPTVSALLKAWPDVIKSIKQRAPLTGAMMGGLVPLRMDGDTVILQLTENNVHIFKRLSNSIDLTHIAGGFRAVLGRPVDVKLILPSQEEQGVAVSVSRDQVKEILDMFQGTIIKE